MGKGVDRAIKKVASKVTPRAGETSKQAAIKILKSKGTIVQRGKHLAKGSKHKTGHKTGHKT